MSESANHTQHIQTIKEILGLGQEFSAIDIASKKALPRVVDLPVPEPQDEQRNTKAVLPPPPIPAVAAQRRVLQLRGYLNRDLIRLPLIFAVALVFFFVILNFGAVKSQVSSIFVSPPKNDRAVLGDNLPLYQNWMKKYYIFSSNQNALGPNDDADHDGLKNIEEFYLGTNPLGWDTNGNGVGDGEDMLQGSNPLYKGSITGDQQKIIDERVDLRQIQKTLDYYEVRGITKAVDINQGAIAQSYSEYSNAEVFTPEPSKAGNLKIPRIGLDVAVVWSENFSRMEEDLKWGVAHHPTTVYPGQRGLSSIHGHSSGYFWDGKYKTAFTKINFLEEGDEVFVTVFSAIGDSQTYRFVVRGKKIYNKNDPAQFLAPEDGYFLNLSTSWPIGTARDRYVVTTELVGP